MVDCLKCKHNVYDKNQIPCCDCFDYDQFEQKEKENPTPDMVNKPPHYNKYQTEVIDIIEDCLTKEQFEGYLLGNMIKYRMRAGWKIKRDEDLKKSNWYQDKLKGK